MIAAAENLDLRLSEVKQHADNDQVHQQLLQTDPNGFPEHKSQLPLPLHPYWVMRDRLVIDDGLLVCGAKLVIPKSLRKSMMERLHHGHQGVNGTKNRARHEVYWPNIDQDLEKLVQSCAQCQEDLPSQPKESYIRHDQPDHAFQYVSADLGTYASRQYLIIVDHM